MELLDPVKLPKLTRIEHYVDSAFKEGVNTDFSVRATWGRGVDDNAYLLNLWRKRVEFPELIEALVRAYKELKRPLVIEDKASGQSAIQVLKRMGLPVIAYKIKGGQGNSKTARAEAVTGWVEAGRAYIPADAPWREDFVDEHAAFPSGVHDDMVDTTAMALSRLLGVGRLKLPEPSEWRLGADGKTTREWSPFAGEQRKLANIARKVMKKEDDNDWMRRMLWD